LVEETAVRRHHYESRRQIEDHLAAFLDAYDFARRLSRIAFSR
jgi:hypothetical protein